MAEAADADLAPLVFGSPINMFIFGVAAGVTVLSVVWLATARGKVWLGRRRRARYEPVTESKFELGEDEDGDDTMVGDSSFYDQDDELRKSNVKVGEVAEQEKLLKGDVDVPQETGRLSVSRLKRPVRTMYRKTS